jgi:hypothetical protein
MHCCSAEIWRYRCSIGPGVAPQQTGHIGQQYFQSTPPLQSTGKLDSVTGADWLVFIDGKLDSVTGANWLVIIDAGGALTSSGVGADAATMIDAGLVKDGVMS